MKEFKLKKSKLSIRFWNREIWKYQPITVCIKIYFVIIFIVIKDNDTYYPICIDRYLEKKSFENAPFIFIPSQNFSEWLMNKLVLQIDAFQILTIVKTC